jgi:hypothetical protein
VTQLSQELDATVAGVEGPLPGGPLASAGQAAEPDHPRVLVDRSRCGAHDMWCTRRPAGNCRDSWRSYAVCVAWSSTNPTAAAECLPLPLSSRRPDRCQPIAMKLRSRRELPFVSHRIAGCSVMRSCAGQGHAVSLLVSCGNVGDGCVREQSVSSRSVSMRSRRLQIWPVSRGVPAENCIRAGQNLVDGVG